jgi:hypothetical protein
VSKNSPLSDQACNVSAHDGEVSMNDANGMDVTLTPEAAEQTADSLIEESVKARGQRRMRNNLHQAI